MKIFKWLAWIKIYFNGMYSYIGIINFILLLMTFKNLYKINIDAIVLVPLCVFLALVVGYVDYRFVQKHQNTFNNEINDLKTDLKKILNKLEGEKYER